MISLMWVCQTHKILYVDQSSGCFSVFISFHLSSVFSSISLSLLLGKLFPWLLWYHTFLFHWLFFLQSLFPATPSLLALWMLASLWGWSRAFCPPHPHLYSGLRRSYRLSWFIHPISSDSTLVFLVLTSNLRVGILFQSSHLHLDVRELTGFGDWLKMKGMKKRRVENGFGSEQLGNCCHLLRGHVLEEKSDVLFCLGERLWSQIWIRWHEVSYGTFK